MAILRTEQELEKKATTKDRYSIEFTVNDYLAIIADIKASSGAEVDPVFTASAAFNITSAISDGLVNALTLPSVANPFATLADLPSGGGDLAATLVLGKVTGPNDIELSAGQVLASISGGSELNLRPFGNDNEIVLATDQLNYGEVGFEMYPTYFALWGAAYDQYLSFNNSIGIGQKFIEMANNIAGEAISIRAGGLGGGSAGEGDIIIFDPSLATKNSTMDPKRPVLVSASDVGLAIGLVNSVAVATSGGFTMKTDNTLYVNQLARSGALGFETRLDFLVSTSDRVVTVKAETGTLALLSDIPADTSFPSDISDGLSVLQVSAAGGTFSSASDSSTIGVAWGSASNSLQPLSNHIVSLGTSGLRYANIFSREFLASIGRTNISGYSWTGITDDRMDNTTGAGGGPSIVSGSRRVLKTPSATGGADVIIATNMSTAEEGNASACLEVQSTVSGFLNARMTTVQRDAIGSPAAGLQIYNTTSAQFEGYNGSSWIILG